MDVPRSDADAAAAVGLRACARRHHAGAVRPDKARLRVVAHHVLHLHHVVDRNAFCDGNDQRHAGIDALQDRIGREGRRHENSGSGGARLASSVGHGIEDGDAVASVLKSLPTFARSDAGHHLRAIVDRELRVPRAKGAGDALNQNARLRRDKNSHVLVFKSGNAHARQCRSGREARFASRASRSLLRRTRLKIEHAPQLGDGAKIVRPADRLFRGDQGRNREHPEAAE